MGEELCPSGLRGLHEGIDAIGHLGHEVALQPEEDVVSQQGLGPRRRRDVADDRGDHRLHTTQATDLIDLWTSLVQHLTQLFGTIGDEETVGEGWAQFHCRDHGTQLGQRTGTDDGPERRCCRVRGGVEACHPFRLGLCGSER